MFYWLAALSDGGDAFNLFRYITFRAGGAFFTALVFGFLFAFDILAAIIGMHGEPSRVFGSRRAVTRFARVAFQHGQTSAALLDGRVASRADGVLR